MPTRARRHKEVGRRSDVTLLIVSRQIKGTHARFNAYSAHLHSTLVDDPGYKKRTMDMDQLKKTNPLEGPDFRLPTCGALGILGPRGQRQSVPSKPDLSVRGCIEVVHLVEGLERGYGQWLLFRLEALEEDDCAAKRVAA